MEDVLFQVFMKSCFFPHRARTVKSLQVAITHKFRRHLVDLKRQLDRNKMPLSFCTIAQSAPLTEVPPVVSPCPTLPLQLSVSVD